MYSGEKHVDVYEAMKHNRLVEEARTYTHLRNCELSPAYKRVYERRQRINKTIQQQQNYLFCAIQEAIGNREVSDLPGNDGRDISPSPKELEKTVTANPLSCFILATMFMTKEQWAQIQEDIKAMAEMDKVDKEYDSQIILLSGFEW